MRKAKVFSNDYNFDKYLNSGSMQINRNLKINEETRGVEIIELDNSITSDSGEHQNIGRHHAWCYTDMNQRGVYNDHNVNKTAREKRRMKNKVHPDCMSKYSECVGHSNRDVYSTSSQDVATDTYSSIWDDLTEKDTLTNNALNCFTIMKNDVDNSESSSDKENGGEITQCGDIILETNQQSNDDDLNEIIYRKRLNSSRQTILIYSFKNRNILGEEITKAVEEYSEDSTSESSLEDIESVHLDDINDNRDLSTPPPPYIPRLNFFAAATLPTVTEVTEPYQFSSDNVQRYANNTPEFSSNNIWVKRNKNHLYQEKVLTESHKFDRVIAPSIPSSNIVNWLSLSPRDQKRNFKINSSGKNLVLVEDSISFSHEAKYDQKHDVICASEANLKTNFVKSLNFEDATDDRKILDQTNNQFTIDEKGDHKKVRQLRKPQIRLERISANSIITDPIEKLNGDGWIGLEYEREDKPDFDVDTFKGSYENDMNKPKESNRCAGDRLFSRNMSLLKPVEWSEYLPITESMPSIYLSLPLDLNGAKRPWLKRIIKLFQCCKKCK